MTPWLHSLPLCAMAWAICFSIKPVTHHIHTLTRPLMTAKDYSERIIAVDDSELSTYQCKPTSKSVPKIQGGTEHWVKRATCCSSPIDTHSHYPAAIAWFHQHSLSVQTCGQGWGPQSRVYVILFVFGMNHWCSAYRCCSSSQIRCSRTVLYCTCTVLDERLCTADYRLVGLYCWHAALSFTHSILALSTVVSGHAVQLPALHQQLQPRWSGVGSAVWYTPCCDGHESVTSISSSTSTLLQRNSSYQLIPVHGSFSIARWQTAGPPPAVHCSRFPGNLVVFIPGNSGMKKSRNLGRPGNGSLGMKSAEPC